MRTRVSKCLAVLVMFAIGAAGGVASAQSRMAGAGDAVPACGVAVDSARVDSDVLYFNYKNTSRKDVSEVFFQAAYFDAEQQVHPVEVDGANAERVRPGEYSKGSLNIGWLRREGYAGIYVWPVTVRYKDGSEWHVSQTRADCGVEQRGNRQTVRRLTPERRSTATSLMAANQSVHPSGSQ